MVHKATNAIIGQVYETIKIRLRCSVHTLQSTKPLLKKLILLVLHLDLDPHKEQSCLVLAAEKPPVLQKLELHHADRSDSSLGTGVKATTAK